MDALKQLHLEPSDELRDLASLYALDSLTQDQKAVYEAHLSAGCSVCASETESFRKVAGAIGSAADPVSPRKELRERLMRNIQTVQQAAPSQAPGVLYDKGGVLIARTREMDWQPGQLPGVFAKVLFNDSARGYTTAMVRMIAGTHYPSHKHAGVEELYLREGDLFVGDLGMQPGDYCRGDEGSIHGEISTKAGCLFMVTSCHRDELLT